MKKIFIQAQIVMNVADEVEPGNVDIEFILDTCRRTDNWNIIDFEDITDEVVDNL